MSEQTFPEIASAADADRLSAAEFFEAGLPVVEEVIRFHSWRGRLGTEEREDFRSWAICKLIENDYNRIRKFEGRSSFRTFLSVTVAHLLLDYWASKNGRRRASSAARAHAPEGPWLERYLEDGYTVSEAVALVRANHDSARSEEELQDLAARLSSRRPRRRTALEPLPPQVSSEERSPERLLEARLSDELRRRLEASLEYALDQLPAEERAFVLMRFEDGSRINEIARAFRVPEKIFYRRFQKTLRALGEALAEAGFDAGCLVVYDEARERRADFRARFACR